MLKVYCTAVRVDFVSFGCRGDVYQAFCQERHRDNQSLQNLPELQYSILSASGNYLKDDGVILYSTCTLNPEENERVVERFLEENAEFSPVDFTVGGLKSTSGMLTLLPHVHGTDGFFIAKLRKEKK